METFVIESLSTMCSFLLSTEVVASRALANIVISDSNPPGTRDQLAMALKGGAVLETSLLMEGDGKGACLAFKGFMKNPKFIYITKQFKKEYKGAYKDIRSTVQ